MIIIKTQTERSLKFRRKLAWFKKDVYFCTVKTSMTWQKITPQKNLKLRWPQNR